jgi:DNA repair protein RecO (recombination protein O)
LSVIIKGVKIPGKIGLDSNGIKEILFGSILSAGTGRSLMGVNLGKRAVGGKGAAPNPVPLASHPWYSAAMGNRNHVFDALVLRRWPIGDAHRGVGFLTRERGPLTAIAHGAAQSKGRLKLLTTPLRRVLLKAYHDPVADSWKVVDLEALDLYGGLAEDLDRSATASIWTEVLGKTQVAGQESELYDLFAEGLALLDRVRGTEVARLHLQVLWRALEFAGLAPDFSTCGECGRPLAGLPVALLPPEGEPLCPTCTDGRGAPLSARSIDSLLSTAVLPLEESLSAPVDPVDLTFLTIEALGAWERAVGSPLKSVRAFQGGLV